MDFWTRIDSLIEYKNISRKELAAKADFSYSSFTNGMRRSSVPAADVALRIAKVLGVTVEYLFDEENNPVPQEKDTIKFMQIFDTLSERDKRLIFTMAKEMQK